MIEPEPQPFFNRPYSLFYRLARACSELLVAREIHVHNIQSTVTLLVNLFSKVHG